MALDVGIPNLRAFVEAVRDAVGPDVTLFKPGDEVFYAGSILRQGSVAEMLRSSTSIGGGASGLGLLLVASV